MAGAPEVCALADAPLQERVRQAGGRAREHGGRHRHAASSSAELGAAGSLPSAQRAAPAMEPWVPSPPLCITPSSPSITLGRGTGVPGCTPSPLGTDSTASAQGHRGAGLHPQPTPHRQHRISARLLTPQLNLPENTCVFPQSWRHQCQADWLEKSLQNSPEGLQSLQALPGSAAFEIPLTGLIIFIFFYNKEIKCKLPCHRINNTAY